MLEQQLERQQWEDIDPQETLASDADDDDCAQAEEGADGSAKRHNRRRRPRKTRHAKETIQPVEATQESPQLGLTTSAVRCVSRSVVTWSDLLDPVDTTPHSQASTSASSPIPSPPLSARAALPFRATAVSATGLSCFGLPAATATQHVPVVFVPAASFATFSTTPLPASRNGVPEHCPPEARIGAAGCRPVCVSPVASAASSVQTSPEQWFSHTVAGAQQSWTEDHTNALRQWLFHGLAGADSVPPAAESLEGLLQSASQGPYED